VEGDREGILDWLSRGRTEGIYLPEGVDEAPEADALGRCQGTQCARAPAPVMVRAPSSCSRVFRQRLRRVEGIYLPEGVDEAPELPAW
jgi:hypothetical protein